MAIIGGTQFLERLTFFNGERLFAEDLQTLESVNREMRWLHNQSLHQPGVGSGYAVTGSKGDRQVTVTPGYAIDACGREIVLTENHVEPIPPVAGNNGLPASYDLTVSYPTDSDLVESQTRQGICLPQGAVRLREAPNFCWIELGQNLQPKDPQLKIDEQTNMRIVLARVQVLNCQLYQQVSTAQRRNARQSTRPRVVCGRSGPSGLNWSFASTGGAHAVNFGLQIDIDTSAARFQTPPCYSAYILGDRLFTNALDGLEPPFLLDGWVNISSPSATAFTLQMVMPDLSDDIKVNPARFFSVPLADVNTALAGNDWSVVWLGVEP
jgi:hypothetical protein